MSSKSSVELGLVILGLALCAAPIAQAKAQSGKVRPAAVQPSTIEPAEDASAAAQQTGAAPTAESVTVTGVNRHRSPGGGLISVSNAVKSVETTSRDFILQQPATTNVMRLLAQQPGAVVSSPDPFGLQPGGITVRGLNNAEIAWNFEGAPANDGAIYPNELVDTQNLEQVSLVPGSTDFDLPASGAAAGAVQILFHNPSHQAGGRINVSYGSFHTHNEYIRLESGDIGNTGLRGFFSFSNTEGNDWRSPGQNYRQHIDFKAIKEWKGGSQAALSIAFSDVNFQVERPPTMAAWQQSGINYTYSRTFTPGDTNFYRLHQNPFENVFASMPMTFIINRKIKFYADPYFYYGFGVIPGGTNLSTSSAYVGTQQVSGLSLYNNGNGSPSSSTLLYSPTLINLIRSGFNTNITYQINQHHQLMLGYWYEYSERHNVGQFSYVGATGVPNDVMGVRNLVKLPNGDDYRFTDYLARSQTNDIYFGDRMRFLNGRLAVDVGIKDIMLTQNAFNRIPGTTYNTNANNNQVLPSIGVRYSIDKVNQVFADVGVNGKTPETSQLLDSVSATTGKVTTRGGNAQKPEVSIVEEIGYRYQGDLLVGTVTLFNYNFVNRQVATIAYQNNAQINQYINAGGQTSRGVDLSVGTRPWHHIRPFISAEYLHATIDNNIERSGDLLPTKGKTATGSPHWTANASLSYDDGSLFGLFSFHYVSSQFSTFMNDQKMPAFYTTDLTLGYRMPNIWHLQHPTFQLNLVNLNNNKYLTGINSTTFNAVSTTGIYGTTIAGSSPTYLVGSGRAAIGSITLGF